MRAAKVIIDLQAIQHNHQQIQQMAPDSQIIAVLKANAYGHGIVPVAKTLSNAEMFAVACIEEAIELRMGGVTQPIVLLEGYFEASELKLVDELRLQLVIHQNEQIEALRFHHFKQPIDVWLKLDSGMNRLGLSPEQFPKAYRALKTMRSVSSIRLMTHFACADDIKSPSTQEQLSLFEKATSSLYGERSAANSAAVIAWPESHFDWVRPGLALYGCSPFPNEYGALHQLKPAMTLESKLIAIKLVEAGKAVGYGATWIAKKDTNIGIIAMGYGDGYPRHAGNGTPVWINGREVPIAGRVCMDMLAVDLGSRVTDQVGDRVVLWGNELPVEKVAQYAHTIPYTLLCGVSSRVKRGWRLS